MCGPSNPCLYVARSPFPSLYLLVRESMDVQSLVLHLDDDYVVINKPPDVRMDREYPVTAHKIVHKILATADQPERECMHNIRC